MTTAAIPVHDHKIHARGVQKLIWTGLSVLLGAGFIAGLYWLAFEQSPTAKTWWDSGMGFIHSPHWVYFRHGIRDDGEPAVWTMIGATILGAVKIPPKRLLPPFLLVIAPVILLSLIVAGSMGITWLIHFSPRFSTLPDTLSWKELVLGMCLGRALHFLWAPIGATIRYHVIARSAVKTAEPLWVKLPLVPPTWREAWWKLNEDRHETAAQLQEVTAGGGSHVLLRTMVPLAVLGFLFVAIVGLLAKYGVAHGVHIPVMNP